MKKGDAVRRAIADLHFTHKNLILGPRGFSSVKEHDEYIIDRWNSVVNKRDITYILGDLTMEKATNYHLLDRLYGMKIVVAGNHERYQHAKQLINYVQGITGAIKLGHNGQTLMLTHIPVHPMEFDGDRFQYNIHGHIHDKVVMQEIQGPGHSFLEPDPRYKCVSCEQVDYTPQTFNQILGLE